MPLNALCPSSFQILLTPTIHAPTHTHTHTHTGLGAISISRLQDASSSTISAAHFLNSSTHITNIVVITTTFIGDVEAHINHLLHLHSSSPSSSLSIISSLSEQLHTEELPNIYGPNCFSILRDRLLTAHPHLFNNNTDIKIVYAPSLNICPITSNIFTLPPSSAAASLPHALGLPAGWCPVEDIDEEEEKENRNRDKDRASLPSSSSKHQGAALLAHTLSHVAASIGCRVEGFTLGPFSKLIGRALAFVPPPPSSSSSFGNSAGPERSAALILVDRVMDLVSPLLCEDILVQKMFHVTTTTTGEEEEEGGLVAPWSFASMPELYQSYVKVKEDGDKEEEKGSNSSINKNNPNNNNSVLRGTMMHPHDKEASKQLEFLMMTRKGKDAPLFVRKWLKEALRREGLQPSMRMKPGSAVGPGELAALASTLLNLSPPTTTTTSSSTSKQQQKVVQTGGGTITTTKESSSKSPSIIGRNLSLLQLALAADQAIDDNEQEEEGGKSASSSRSIMKRYNALATEQNHCLLSCSEGSAAVVSFFLDLIPLVISSSNHVLTLVDVFSLILMAHSIKSDFVPWFGNNNNGEGFEGAFSADEEAQILQCIVDHLTRDNGDSDSSSGIITRGNILPPSSVLCHPEGDLVLRQYIHSLADLFQSPPPTFPIPLSSKVLVLQSRDILSDILTRLRHLAAFHHNPSSSLKELKRTTRTSHQDGSISHAPLLEQLTEKALMAGEVISDLTPAAASLAGLLKTGLGRFGIQKAQPKPSDHDVVMIFVVGGASVGEIHHVMQAASAAQQQMSGSGQEGKSGPPIPQKKIVFGCTRLLT
jgi:hypothetical protein